MPKRNIKPEPRTYEPEPFVKRLLELLEARNESYREASLEADLDHQAVRRYIHGKRPDRQACIVLADHFGINPNELLTLAGYATLKIFEPKTVSAKNLPPEAVAVAVAIAKIPDPGTRREVAKAIQVLLKKYFTE